MADMKEVKSKIDSCKMLKDIDSKDLLDYKTGYAYIIAGNSRDLKTTQLRKFFGVLRKMEQNDDWDSIESEFYLLKPRMAVSAGRKHVPEQFYKVIMTAMDKVDVGDNDEKMENFKKFIEFFEAIVAYHKYLELEEENRRKKNNRKQNNRGRY